jgi:predicted dehydrogenase
LLDDADVEVTALCDRDVKQALQMAAEFGLAPLIRSRVNDLRGHIDAAIVAVPHRFHAPVTVELLEMGIDVLCEKPLALTVADAERMAHVAQRTGRILAVALMMRFFPQNLWLKELVDAGEVGRVIKVIAQDGAPLDWPMASNSYFDREASGGGVLFDMGIHYLDRVLWLFGQLGDISYEDDSFGGFETNARLRGVLTIGGERTPALMEFSWSHDLQRSIQVVGTKGTLEAPVQDPKTLLFRRGVGNREVEMRIPCAKYWDATSHYRAQLDDFIEAVRDRREPFVSASSAVHALAVVEEAYARRQPMVQPWLTHARHANDLR